MPFPDAGQDDNKPDLASAIGEAIQAILPNIVAAVVAKIGDSEAPSDAMPGDDMDPTDQIDGVNDADADADNVDADAGNVNDSMDSPADSPADATDMPRGGNPTDNPADNPADDSSAADNDTAIVDPTDNPAAPGDPGDKDPEANKYRAMGTQCYEAYMAGRRNATKYARGTMPKNSSARPSAHPSANRNQNPNDGLAVIVARQSKEIQKLRDDIATERRDVSRYAKLNELSREFAFDPKDEFETCGDMTDAQFERHCTKTVTKYSKRGDFESVDLYDDPNLEPSRYSRGGSAGGARVNPEQIQRYSREAATIASQKNARKPGSTTFEAEFDAICKQHGVTV